MTETLAEDPWTDEVCIDWIDQEIERTGNSVIEEESMPPAVLTYVKELVRQQYFGPDEDRATTWAKASLLASVRVINVDLPPEDR